MYFGYTSVYGFPERVQAPIATILGMKRIHVLCLRNRFNLLAVGLSLDCSIAGPNCTWQGPYLLPQMKNASIINTMATSIYLGPDDVNVTNAKMLLGGAYDKAKVDGELFTVDMVDPHDVELTSSQTNNVNVTALEVVLDGGNRTYETYGDKDIGVPVLIDTGIASWYLTDKTFAAVYHGLGGLGEPDTSKRVQPIDCRYRDPSNAKGHISVEFGTAGKVEVPLHTLVTKFPDGTCGAFISPRGDTVSTLGDPFLRGVYSIYDQERLTITFGKVRHTTEEQIVPFPEGGFRRSA